MKSAAATAVSTRPAKPTGATAALANIALLERELGHLVYEEHRSRGADEAQAARRKMLLARIDEEHQRLAALRRGE